MSESFEEKTEQPTQKKLERAREKGQVAQSKEVGAIITLAALLLYFAVSGDALWSGLESVARRSFIVAGDAKTQIPPGFIESLIRHTFSIMIPPFALVFAFGLGNGLLQTGVAFSTHPLEPDLNKINPISGLKKIFGWRGIFEVVKSAFKMGGIVAIAWFAVEKILSVLMNAHGASLESLFSLASWSVLSLAFKFTLFLGTLAAIDYGFQKWQFERDQRMTKQEVREEYKEDEGDPQIKARRRRLQREMSMNRMLTMVPRADVVVTNPTHYAVALKYDKAKNRAPVVVAKGAGEIAKKIREIAYKHGIPRVEKPEVARMLYRKVDVGKEIPEALYKAVAEILAYVYKLRRG